MKVVIDTNVLISAALKDRDPEAVILCILTQTQFEWVVSADILQEYKEVLARPKFALLRFNLRRTRDLLLPKLVSGEMDVENIKAAQV